MGSFGWGLLGGWLSALMLCGVGAVIAYRRFERLQQRTRQAERLAELGTLTGGLAHEIKNPLSTVQLNLQLLGEDLLAEHPGASRLHSRLHTVQKETGRLREILDDFLRYAGKLEIDRKPVEVNALLEELVDFFNPQAQALRVQLRVRPSPDKLVVGLDERLIKQGILNLMINATQAMPPEGGEIILSARREGDWAFIEIMDTGRGIPPQSQEKVFDAYYSTKSGGTGLGLAITRRAVEEHGGRISVRSEVEKGTAFTIALPV
jgi:two-component system sensor histidine kinase HydH